MRNDRPFAFAGLWDRCGELESCTILTTDANDVARPIHDRMPVILPPELYDVWLDPQVSPDELQSLLRPYPADEMEAYRIGTLVNKPQNDVPECVARVE